MKLIFERKELIFKNKGLIFENKEFIFEDKLLILECGRLFLQNCGIMHKANHCVLNPQILQIYADFFIFRACLKMWWQASCLPWSRHFQPGGSSLDIGNREKSSVGSGRQDAALQGRQDVRRYNASAV